MTWSRRGLLMGLGALPVLGCGGSGRGEHVPPAMPEGMDVSLPTVSGHLFQNGAQLYLVEDHGLPLVAIAVALRVGFGHEQPGQEGIATLASQLLLEGIEGGDRTSLLARYGDLGAAPTSGASDLLLLLRCTVHRADAPAALGLMLDNLRHPTLSEAAFERLRRVQLDEVAAAKGDPEAIAGLGLTLGTFGIDPPLLAMGVGTGHSLSALDLATVQTWLRAHTQPSRLSFAFAGATKLDEAAGWVAHAAGSWVEESQSLASGHVVPALGPRTVLVDWPDIGRPLLAFGVRDRRYADPDEFSSAMADSIVGGFLHSELRDRQRLSYGLRARTWSTRFGPLAARWTSLEPSTVGQAISATRALLTTMRSDPRITEALAAQGLADMRRSYYVEMMTDFDGPDAALSQLLHLAERSLSPSTPTTRLNSFMHLDSRRIAAVLRSAYDPDALRMCVVGDAATLAQARDLIGDPQAVVRTPEALTGVVPDRRPTPTQPASPQAPVPAATQDSPEPAIAVPAKPAAPPSAPAKPTPHQPIPQKPTPQRPTPKKPGPKKPGPKKPGPKKPGPKKPGPKTPSPSRPAVQRPGAK